MALAREWGRTRFHVSNTRKRCGFQGCRSLLPATANVIHSLLALDFIPLAGLAGQKAVGLLVVDDLPRVGVPAEFPAQPHGDV